MLPHINFAHLFSRFPPCVEVLLRPVNVAFGVCNLPAECQLSLGNAKEGDAYHVPLEILFLLQLEAL